MKKGILITISLLVVVAHTFDIIEWKWYITNLVDSIVISTNYGVIQDSMMGEKRKYRTHEILKSSPCNYI